MKNVADQNTGINTPLTLMVCVALPNWLNLFNIGRAKDFVEEPQKKT